MTKPCDRCGAKMVRVRSGLVLSVVPNLCQYAWYCGCGAAELAGYGDCSELKSSVHRMWQMANSGLEPLEVLEG